MPCEPPSHPRPAARQDPAPRGTTLGRRRLWRRVAFSCAAVLALAGCATTPAFEIGTADKTLTPHAAASSSEANRWQGRQVAWGGMIIAGHNLTDSTLLEVLAYPLDDDNRPRPEAEPLGRFLISYDGYLETADYAPGRLVTVVGRLVGTQRGQIGEAAYLYPVVAAERLERWPRRAPRAPSEPSVHFGIGIGIVK